MLKLLKLRLTEQKIFFVVIVAGLLITEPILLEAFCLGYYFRKSERFVSGSRRRTAH